MNTPESPVTDAHGPRLTAALDALREQAPPPPALDEIRAGARRRQAASLPSRDVVLASVATAVAALIFVVLTIKPALGGRNLYTGEERGFELARLSVATLLPAGVLGWALVLLRQRHLGAQLLTRAIWWSNLIVGVLIATNFTNAGDRWLGASVGFACAVPLFILGSKGLDARDPDHPFSPVRFRGLLLLALVMAFADAQTLLFSALMQLRIGMSGWSMLGTLKYAGPTILSAGLMTLTVWGIYRLRTWALLLNLVANFAIAYLALEGTLELSPSVGMTLAATAAVQAFIPVPILASALGDREAGQPVLGSRAPGLLRGAFVFVALWGAAAALVFHGNDGWVTGPGRAFHRGLRGFDAPAERLLAPGADFSNRGIHHRVSWKGLDGTGASLRGSSLRNVDLTGAVLVRLDGRGADFRMARLEGVNFTGANLQGALFSTSDFGGSTDTESRATQRRDVDFTDATCPDGHRSSTPRGCDTHLGLVSKDIRRLYTATTSVRGCREAGEERLAVTVEGRLSFAGVFWTEQLDGSFLGRKGETLHWHDGQKIAQLHTEACGDERFELRAEESP